MTKKPFTEDGVIGQERFREEEVIDMAVQITFEEVANQKEAEEGFKMEVVLEKEY